MWAGLAAAPNKPFAPVKRFFAAILAVTYSCTPFCALADPTDGYESSLAQSVRLATERYRLVVWAQQDGYVQTTDYVASFGTMYTNHQRFDPKQLSTPTMLVFDLAGRLVACGYQFTKSSAIFSALSGPDVHGWYNIPKHIHYNIVDKGTTYYAQQPWNSDEQPTTAALIQRKLMPPDATLTFAFVHPATRAILIWAWNPNRNGLFESDNPSMP
jgi:hypothetical protein